MPPSPGNGFSLHNCGYGYSELKELSRGQDDVALPGNTRNAETIQGPGAISVLPFDRGFLFSCVRAA